MRSIVLIGTALIGVVSARSASAQAEDTAKPQEAASVTTPRADEGITEIVVTGIRESLAEAVEIKRQSDSIRDVIAAEDIAKFPDQNLAESLQRIPGVQIDRNKGEGASVSVRGLGSNFTSTFYNGRVIPSPAGGRDFSFTSLGSDFVRSLEVIKSPTADLIDGGLAAAINAKVTRPLDLGRDTTATTAEGIYEENPDKYSPHFSFFTNQILVDDVFGINLGIDYKERGVIQAGFNSWGLETKTERSPTLDYNRDGDFSDRQRVHHALALWSDEGEFRRLNVIAGMQLRPLENVTLYADGIYSRFEDEYIRYEHQIRFTNIGGSNARIYDSEVTGDGIVTYLDADGVDNRAGGRDTYVDDRTYSFALGGAAEFGPLTITAEGTTSEAERLNSFVQLSMITRARASYDIRENFGALPRVSFNRGYDPFDPSPYYMFGINGELESPTRDTNDDFRLDATYDTSGGLLTRIKTGIYVADAQKSYRYNRYSFTPQLTASMLGVPFTTAEGGSVLASSLLRAEDYSDYVGEQIGHYLAPDRDKVFANVSLNDFLAVSPTFTDESQNYRINEQATAAYGRVDFASDEAISGNLGLRYTRTRLRTQGAAPDFAQLVIMNDGSTFVPASTPVSVSNDYEYWLPSFNLRWALTPELVVRLAANRAMTRPDLGILTPRTSINGLQRTISSQNPNVKPYLANQADLSFECYFGREGILSAALFYKDVENFIITRTTTETHTVQLESGGAEALEFTRTAPDNGTDTTVKGIELAAQVPLSVLADALQGFGVSANATFLETDDVKTSEDGAPVPVTGVSDRSYTVGAYFERGGFGIRANYNWRSRYVVSQLANFGDGSFTEPYGQLDVSGSYWFNPNFSIRGDVSNLTHSVQERTSNIGLLRNTYDYGRRFSLGARYRF